MSISTSKEPAGGGVVVGVVVVGVVVVGVVVLGVVPQDKVTNRRQPTARAKNSLAFIVYTSIVTFSRNTAGHYFRL